MKDKQRCQKTTRKPNKKVTKFI